MTIERMVRLTERAGSTTAARALIPAALLPTAHLLYSGCTSLSPSDRGDDKSSLVDLTGERWKIDQAISLGFSPAKFGYGVGRDYFPPLDDSYLRDEATRAFPHTRIIGLARGNEARAYTVSRLTSHEVSNSVIGSEPIAVGY
jgi:hypothetical protein